MISRARPGSQGQRTLQVWHCSVVPPLIHVGPTTGLVGVPQADVRQAVERVAQERLEAGLRWGWALVTG